MHCRRCNNSPTNTLLIAFQTDRQNKKTHSRIFYAIRMRTDLAAGGRSNVLTDQRGYSSRQTDHFRSSGTRRGEAEGDTTVDTPMKTSNSRTARLLIVRHCQRNLFGLRSLPPPAPVLPLLRSTGPIDATHASVSRSSRIVVAINSTESFHRRAGRPYGRLGEQGDVDSATGRQRKDISAGVGMTPRKTHRSPLARTPLSSKPRRTNDRASDNWRRPLNELGGAGRCGAGPDRTGRLHCPPGQRETNQNRSEWK